MKGINNYTKLFFFFLMATVFLGGCKKDDAIYYVHGDQLGTPEAVTDQAKKIVWEGHHKPFGEIEVVTSTISQPMRFPGQYFDQETGLSYNLMRDYDPTLGRFIESDPIGLAGGNNTFGYAYQSPILNYDQDGRSTTVAGEGIGFIFGGPPGAVVGAIVGTGIGVVGYAIYQVCKSEDKDCPACNPPKGTVRYRIDMVPPSKPHYPHTGSHVHLYKMNQNPNNCQCFWQPIGTTELPPPAGIDPM